MTHRHQLPQGGPTGGSRRTGRGVAGRVLGQAPRPGRAGGGGAEGAGGGGCKVGVERPRSDGRERSGGPPPSTGWDRRPAASEGALMTPDERAGPVSDEAPLSRATRDATALEPLVVRHSAALHGYFARRAPGAADDLLAEAWLQAYAARRGFDAARGPARAWLLGVARNVLSAHWRQTARPRPGFPAGAGATRGAPGAASARRPPARTSPPRAHAPPVRRTAPARHAVSGPSHSASSARAATPRHRAPDRRPDPDQHRHPHSRSGRPRPHPPSRVTLRRPPGRPGLDADRHPARPRERCLQPVRRQRLPGGTRAARR
ncbi:sigma factor [Streptomyces sp. NPDC087300]|uniref:sigma factor n=1 Tax=Streptomyces sp. NPDC087300 TaxID=3365780 RepID=UPI00382F38B7